jgi:restriction system protein
MTWRDYQEEAADFFRSLRLEAQTDAKVRGVRTQHDIDVLVKSHHAGFEVTWIVECKKWDTRVTKLHVLALREVVNDTGADRGILLSESGFQSGAIEAANLTNVQVTSLSEARLKSEHDINAMRLRDLFDRIETCKTRYWDLRKEDRIEHGLRPKVGTIGYSGNLVIVTAEELLAKGLRGKYPFDVDVTFPGALLDLPKEIGSSRQIIEIVDPIIADLESRLDSAVQDWPPAQPDRA